MVTVPPPPGWSARFELRLNVVIELLGSFMDQAEVMAAAPRGHSEP
jgi:hypothetical protein